MEQVGVTNTGFVTKSFATILTDIQSRLQSLFGADIDLTPGSPMRVISELYALELAKVWTELKNVYDMGFILTATGSSLNALAALVGIERDLGTAATGEVTFYRTEVLPAGSASRVIPINTQIQTSEEYPITYYTTETVYFNPLITDEAVPIPTASTTFNTENIIGEIVSIIDNTAVDWTTGATFSSREVTVNGTIPTGRTVYITYKPLSVTASVQSVLESDLANVIANSLTVLPQAISFVHSVANEAEIVTGTNTESDASLRMRIQNAAKSLGKATNPSITTGIRNVDGVSNVIVKELSLTHIQDSFVASGTSDTIPVSEGSVNNVVSVTGSVSGAFEIESFETAAGIVLTTNYQSGETVSVDYYVEDYTPTLGQGIIKVFVSGGQVADIVDAIEEYRAAGIKAVGYGTNSVYAYGEEDYPFSWFYRLEDALIDITVTVYFDPDTTLNAVEKTNIRDHISDEITDFVNNLATEEKLWVSKIIQLAMSVSSEIETVTVNLLQINDVPSETYVASAETEMPVSGTITINEG
ncbi:baseplate J/gp47 family protein [Bacteroides sp.]|uniref:baseplate J/gp47 family protein n=1 Tax=Bacteroides sp. TaxID=29523 RepID=UPI0026366DC6|nr:baseplate J/gp47 family protein [Bacteroides sp.]MDD3039584.1 baseplate J/gp47 family protein [Bacteroides sp.]